MHKYSSEDHERKHEQESAAHDDAASSKLQCDVMGVLSVMI